MIFFNIRREIRKGTNDKTTAAPTATTTTAGV